VRLARDWTNGWAGGLDPRLNVGDASEALAPVVFVHCGPREPRAAQTRLFPELIAVRVQATKLGEDGARDRAVTQFRQRLRQTPLGIAPDRPERSLVLGDVRGIDGFVSGRATGSVRLGWPWGCPRPWAARVYRPLTFWAWILFSSANSKWYRSRRPLRRHVHE
jgi:hypothetical protein